MERRCDQETSKTRKLKARYWAVKIQTQWVVTAGKQTTAYMYSGMGGIGGQRSTYIPSERYVW